MSSKSGLVKTSKFLSLILRHAPEKIGLQLDTNGWAEINTLIEKAGIAGNKLNLAVIQEVVRTSEKQRFAISDDGKRIRANQGHSINVDVELNPATPPDILYHGTAERFLPSINKQGLIPGKRLHVHLSRDRETAARVGSRHGSPVVLEINSRQMAEGGNEFWMSENGVWLVKSVLQRYFKVLSS